MLVRLMERIGYSAVTAADGLSSLAALAASDVPFVCVLLDLTMPGMHGIDVAAAIHERAPDLPIIIMSGYSQISPAERRLAFPIAAYLHKPFAIEDLQRAVGRIAPPAAQGA